MAKAILNVNPGSAYAGKNGYTFKAYFTPHGFELIGVSDEFPENKVYFTHKEVILVNLKVVLEFYKNNSMISKYLLEYCNRNKIHIED